MLSIIIPVYNAEATINCCLSSITKQGIDDFEVIIINDGSYDKSREICKDWCINDPRFHLIEQHNSGPSAARNLGIDQAVGKYITFMDSDDELSSDSLRPNLEYMEKHPEVSLIQFPLEVHHTNGNVEKRNTCETTLTGIRVINDIWCRSSDVINGFFWGKIYLASLFKGIRFPIGIRNSEDSWLLCEILPRCNVVRLSKDGAYLYKIHKGSLSFAIDQEQKNRHAVNNMRVLIKKLDNTKRLELSYATQVGCFAYCLTSLAELVNHEGFPPALSREFEDNIDDFPLGIRQIVCSKASLKARLKGLLAKLLGSRRYVGLLGIRSKIPFLKRLS